MSPRVFLIWLVVTLVTLVAAVAAVISQPELSRVAVVNEPAFPDLRARPDAVAWIIVKSEGRSLTLSRGADGQWVAQDKHGYRASASAVRDVIVAMADMQLVEAKTTRPDRYPRLEVEDPDVEGAASRLVRLEDEGGTALATAIIGKRSNRFTAGRDAGTYLRRPDEVQAWLATGAVSLREQIVDWLDTDIVHVASDSVRRVEITPLEGPAYSAVRDAADGALRIEALPEGRVPKDSAGSRLGAALAYLQFTDVMPRADLALPEARSRARIETADGLEVTAELATVDGQIWALFSARDLEPQGAASDASEPAPDSNAPEAAEAGAREAAPGKAAAINARVGEWAYRIEDHVAERLMAPLETLLEDRDGTS